MLRAQWLALFYVDEDGARMRVEKEIDRHRVVIEGPRQSVAAPRIASSTA